MIETGLKNSKKVLVTKANVAKAVGSGTLEVFATPMMIALLEGCCAESVEHLLENGFTSVGTNLSIDHLSPSPIGCEVICNSELIEFNGKVLKFKVEINDNKCKVGEGTHTRVIINKEKFMKKAKEKVE